MKIEWEQHFLDQEKQRREQLKKRRRKLRILLPLCGVILGCLIITAAYSGIRFYQSDYGKIIRAAKDYDYEIVASYMEMYLDEKYEANVCNADKLYVSEWYPSTELPYASFEGYQDDDRGKKVYLICLTKDDWIFMDTWQWEEIAYALEDEISREIGVEHVTADTAVASENSYSRETYENPWLMSGAFFSKYQGDLDAFFREEREAREKHLFEGRALQENPINGAYALYLEAPEVPDMSARVKNPDLPYQDSFLQGIRQMEEKYEMQLFSCVMVGSHYEQLHSEIENKENYGVFPTEYVDFGPEKTFYHPAYTVLSYAYGQLFVTKAEEAAKGIYLFSVNHEKQLDRYEYKETVSEEITKAAKKQYPEKTFKREFSLVQRESVEPSDVSFCMMAIDTTAEGLDKESVPFGEVYNGWDIFRKNKDCPVSIYDFSSYRRQDDFLIFGNYLDMQNSIQFGIY